MKDLPRFQKESGQVLLLILLVMSVALTVVLSIVARSVTDVSISTSQDDSIRAFSAAEAGIERAIIGTVTSGTTYNLTESGANFTPVISSVRGTSFTYDGATVWGFNYPIDLNAGESAIFWFVSHITDANGEEKLSCSGLPCYKPTIWVRICWGQEGSSPTEATTPAIEAEFYYDKNLTPNRWWETSPNNFSGIRVARAASDPYETRPEDSGFQIVTPQACQILGKPYAFQRRIFMTAGVGPNDEYLDVDDWSTFSNGALVLIRVRMFYNSDKTQPVGIITQANIPAQGVLINSTGSSGDTFRKLSVFQSYPEPPFVFNSTVFTSGSITK